MVSIRVDSKLKAEIELSRKEYREGKVHSFDSVEAAQHWLESL